jgi:hypothetical protein
MTAAICSRLFQVEALRDGRLDGAERKSFERHLATCAACAREAEALEKLAAAARAGATDHRGADQLRILRERTRLLATFDRALVSAGLPGLTTMLSPRRWLAPATVAVLMGALVVIWRGRPAVDPASLARANVRAGTNTIWTRQKGNRGREEITLRHGFLRIHVDHAAGEQPVLVRLPDGELEDVGTTFMVTVDDAETTRVAVEDGRVVLRLRGRPAVDIGPGGVWAPEPAHAVPAPTMAPPASETVIDDHRPPPARASRPLRMRAPQPAAAAPDPLADFRAASAELRAGDNRRAANAFARFLDEHPRDPMAEDAAYLRIIALRRLRAPGETRDAAELYLQRFPTGFRRAEVERLANQLRFLP